MTRVDVHQHLLSAPLIAALEERRTPPALVPRRGGWSFRVAGEPDSVLAVEATDVARRAAELGDDGIDRALVALSTALGIETLPAAEAAPLIAAHHQGIEALPAGFGAWGAVALREPDPAGVDAAIARGCVGISLPAGALSDPDALTRLAPLLTRLEHHDAPLFVHPGSIAATGPTGGTGATAGSPPAAASLPPWWPALTGYVAQMQTAWFAFLHAGRAAHPRLRVLFAMLAGGAPLQLERLAARGGPVPAAPDPLVFYDSSSYGPRMLAAMVEAVGTAQLVYGSDRPVVDPGAPPPDGPLGHALLIDNPNRLLTPGLEGDIE